MGRVYDLIDDRLRSWIARQPLFFVGTAPASVDGHVNVSPKGPIGALRVLDGHTVAYLDIVGSGAETIAHLRENGRIVLMLCAFEGPPRILRMHGRGEVITAVDPRFAELLECADFDQPAAPQARRAIIVAHLDRIADSCGYGVPLMTVAGARPHSDAWASKKLRTGGEDALLDYQREKNVHSLDGLPALAPEELQRESSARLETGTALARLEAGVAPGAHPAACASPAARTPPRRASKPGQASRARTPPAPPGHRIVTPGARASVRLSASLHSGPVARLRPVLL